MYHPYTSMPELLASFFFLFFFFFSFFPFSPSSLLCGTGMVCGSIRDDPRFLLLSVDQCKFSFWEKTLSCALLVFLILFSFFPVLSLLAHFAPLFLHTCDLNIHCELAQHLSSCAQCGLFVFSLMYSFAVHVKCGTEGTYCQRSN